MKQIHFSVTIIIFVSSLLLACKDTKGEQKAIQNNIVLIFDTVKANYDTLAYPHEGEMIRFAPVLTFKSDVRKEFLTPRMKIETDTITLNTQSDHLFICYRYNPISSLSFIVERGDTVIIDEKYNTPFLTIQNRKTKDFDINYDFYKKARYGSLYDYSTEEYYNDPQVLFFMLKGIPWQTGKKNAAEKLMAELRDEDIWLDSLYHNRLISEYEYNIYNARNKYKLMTLEVGYKNIFALKEHLREYNDSLFRNDHLGFYSNFYWHCLGTYMDLLTNQSFDFEQLFDSLEHIDIDLGELALRGKLTYLDRIINDYPIESAQKYYNKFIKESNDTVLISNLSKKYHYLFNDTVNNSQDIELMDRSGKKLSFEDIMKKHKGKMIYVDFWASWCEPCLNEMPASKRLRKEYAGKDIVFVYLAIKDKESAWRKAVSTAEWKDVEDNYFILNNKTSKGLENLKVKSIPRYLIYDNNGKLILKNAPRPSDKQISYILDKLLKRMN